MVFPEAFVSCYPRGLAAFGTIIGARTPEGRAWFSRYWSLRSTSPAPAVDRIGAIAAHHQTTWSSASSNVMAELCTARALSSPHRVSVWATSQVDAGVRHQPGAARYGDLLGELHAVTADDHVRHGHPGVVCTHRQSRDTWTASMRHIACEGRCFVLSANQFARRRDYPDDYPLADDHQPDDVMCRGASVIVSPLGEIHAGPAVDSQEILIADIDLDHIVGCCRERENVGDDQPQEPHR